MFLEKMRARASDESGFTLVELLVVMLILGILAAIAIPSFLSQRNKAADSEAKAGVRTAQTAMETYATDNGGSYAVTGAGDLVTIEPTLADATNLQAVGTAPASPGGGTYTVSVDSSTGTEFSITREANGSTSRACSVPNTGGCGASTW